MRIALANTPNVRIFVIPVAARSSVFYFGSQERLRLSSEWQRLRGPGTELLKQVDHNVSDELVIHTHTMVEAQRVQYLQPYPMTDPCP